ncbi:Inner-membrane translocator [uncultured spirochete]|jgi:branched-chain amino acid transport system permease protein|uniref:Inner-membrane translocator n=1 Tax=uncultured spirochete TaxID=156406 RepID=A0A3P3XI80_9SPIR|nr:branched-chain amino acid ABC transporter permease [Rectinema subterraneum]SLM11411.1 Inner-membrane translocator [uncultured spirochete]
MSWTYIQGILMLAGINMIAVLGLSLLTGFTGLFSFGHAGFMAIGAYVGAWISASPASTPAGLGLPFILAIVGGGAAAGIVSYFIGRISLNLKGDYFCIATLGFGEAIRLIFNNVNRFGGARGWPGVPGRSTFLVILIADVIAILFLANLVKSRHGRNMIAVREEELAAQIAGINVFRYKMISLIISAVYAGVAGVFFAHYMTFIQPKMFSLTKSTELTIIVIFGGLGSISGSVLGALVLTALPELLRAFEIWRLVFYGAAVILIMVSRPKGLMGGMELTPSGIRKVLAERNALREAKTKLLADAQSGEED